MISNEIDNFTFMITQRMHRIRSMSNNLITSEQVRQVRKILSEIFVDTEHTELDRAHMAERLMLTGMAFSHIEHIYMNEVAPICSQKFQTVGPWPAIDQTWLNQKIEQRKQSWIHKLPHFFQHISRRWDDAENNPDWKAVSQHLREPDQLTLHLKQLREEIASRRAN